MLKYLLILFHFPLLSISQEKINLDSLQDHLLETLQFEEIVEFGYVKREFFQDSMYVLFSFNYDLNSGKVSENFGVAVSIFEYDDKNKLIETRDYNSSGYLTDSSGPAITRLQYIDSLNLEIKSYFNRNDKPTLLVHKVEFYRNQNFDVIKERTLNEHDECNGPNCIEIFKYSEDRKTVESYFTNRTGEIFADRPWTYKISRFKTSERKILIEESFYDLEHNLAEIETDKKKFYSRILYYYDNREILAKYFSSSGKLIQITRQNI